MAKQWIYGVALGSIVALAFAQGCGGVDSKSGFDDLDPSGTGKGGDDDLTGTGDGDNPFLGDDGGTTDSSTSLPTDQCATASAETKAQPVYMLFIIDGSGSMDGASGNIFFPWISGARESDPMQPSRQTGKKWIAVRGALDAFFDDLAAKNDPQFAVGLYLFSSTAEKSATSVDVPISFVDAAQATKLRARLDPPVFAQGGTPLAASIQGQLPILTSYVPQAPVAAGGKFVLVLVTDGVPSDSATNAIKYVTDATKGTPPVATFAVGVGDIDESSSVYDELFMSKLATAGGTATPGCNANWSDKDKSGVPCHFQITPGTKSAADIQKDFVAAIEQIRDTVASCEFPLVKPDGAATIDPTKVNVVFSSGGKDTTIPQGDKDGWTYDDPANPTKVTLNGAACEQVKNDPNGQVRIVVGCKTVTNGPN